VELFLDVHVGARGGRLYSRCALAGNSGARGRPSVGNGARCQSFLTGNNDRTPKILGPSDVAAPSRPQPK
jgi:hypothetical protein